MRAEDRNMTGRPKTSTIQQQAQPRKIMMSAQNRRPTLYVRKFSTRDRNIKGLGLEHQDSAKNVMRNYTTALDDSIQSVVTQLDEPPS